MKAEYHQVSAFSRAMLNEIKVEHVVAGVEKGEILLYPSACLFWTEHSARAWLPSACVSAGFPPEWVITLAWSHLQSEEYVRTKRQRTERMQKAVAEKCRHGAGASDFLDESSLSEELAAFMMQKGAVKEEVDWQTLALRMEGWHGPGDGGDLIDMPSLLDGMRASVAVMDGNLELEDDIKAIEEVSKEVVEIDPAMEDIVPEENLFGSVAGSNGFEEEELPEEPRRTAAAKRPATHDEVLSLEPLLLKMAV